jgi:hypothetical protein
MYISPKLEWLRPFFKEVKPLYSKSKSIKKITIIRASHSKRDRAYAEVRELDKGYQVALRTQYQHIDFYPLCVTLLPLSKVDILAALAHELAHLYHWTHSPEHKIVENQIGTIFMTRLKNEGYIDEETELEEMK